TGYSGQRGRYADVLEQARRVEESIAAQDAKFQQDRAAFDTSMARFNENLANQTSRIEKNTSVDYLARVNALSRLIQDNEHVRSVYFILLLSLVLLDCLLVILKAVLPMGSYEMIKDKHFRELSIDDEAAVKAKSQASEQESLNKKAESFTNKTNLLYQMLEQNLSIRSNILTRLQEEERKADSISNKETRESFIAQIRQDASECNEAIEHIQAVMMDEFKEK
ncbi:MAG: DUF4407 domain-containing protein, partial [Deferribacteraceae bacterium]|nr:DUF4407 domain-containing protein [Deferribacteraceae bacterium]